VFSGGPAPSANAVISAAALSMIDRGVEVLGFFHGYTNLQHYDADEHPLEADLHYRIFQQGDLRGKRNSRGILIGTSRTNPGRDIDSPADISDPTKTDRLRRIYQALIDLDVHALVSIGGDGTLRTANIFHLWQQTLPADAPRVRVIHLPKTIDNDYHGIDFTFGFFTAADVMAQEVQNMRADAHATSSYFIIETMGRQAGWLAYAVAIAGEAHLVIGVEDLLEEGDTTGVHPDTLTDRIVGLILAREETGQHDGVVVLAEGIGAHLIQRDSSDSATHPEQVSLVNLNLGKFIAEKVSEAYARQTGQPKKVRGVQLGYESRCAPPNAYDVMLGSQLGIGATQALLEHGFDGRMVSVSGQLELRYLPFEDLVDPETLATTVRLITPGSDFHRLARFLEARAEWSETFAPGRRRER
jgi:6-phosphofructokinase